MMIKMPILPSSVFVLTLLVSQGQMWPQNFGGSNLRPSSIGENKLTADNSVPLSPRPATARPSRLPQPQPQPQAKPRPEKTPPQQPPPRPTQFSRSQDPDFGTVGLISTAMQLAQAEGRRPPMPPPGESGPRPNWNQQFRPDTRTRERPSDGWANNSEPGPRGNNTTAPKRVPGKPSNRPFEGGGGGGQIVFPDNNNRFVPSEACVRSGRTFCESMAGYPTAHLKQVLDANLASRFGPLFGADEVEASNITQRFDLPPEDETLCQSEERVIFPTAGQTRDDQWRFIVNQEKFLQGVRIEMCKEEEGKCSFSDSFPLGYHSFCKQKFIYRKLVSLTADGVTSTEEFKLPSCCSCHIRVDAAAMRMAAEAAPKP